jgi:CHAT domain-containing protein
MLKRRSWAVGLILAVLGATLLVVSSRAGIPAFVHAPDSALDALYGASRFVYPRLSRQQAYQPCRPEAEPGLVSGYDCADDPASPGLLRQRWLDAERTLRDAGEGDRRLYGLLRLATIRKGDFAEAARGLEAEARLADDAGLWVDASAAFYLAATAQDLPGLLSPALAASERALELDPRDPAAAFNRALILEALALRSEAREAWRDFLSFEPETSPWRREAQQHLETLSVPSEAERWETAKRTIEAGGPSADQAGELVASFARPVRDWIELELLPAWAQAWLQKDPAAASERLDVAAALAQALETGPREALPAAQVRDVREALQARSAVPALARSILGLRDARTSYVQGEYQSTLDTLDRVERELGIRRPALWYWARYYRAASLDQQGLKPEADALLTSLVADLANQPFPSLRARAQALRGRIKNNLGRPEEAIPLLASATATLDAVRDTETGTWARTLLGDSHRLLGDLESCWQYFYVALHQIENLGTPLRELAAFNATADFLLSAGDDRLALHYLDAAVSLGPRLGNPSFFADVLLWRSLLLSRRGNEPAALADLERAREEAAKVRDPLRVERFRADLGLYMGAELLDRDPAAAVDALTTAVRYFEGTEHWSRILLSLEARALAYGRLGDRESELRDLARARELYEQVGRQLKQDAIRISFAGRIENAFDQTLRLRLAESVEPEASLSQLEQERALNHALLQGDAWLTKPVGISEVRSALAPGMALIEYAVLSDRLLVWLIANGNVSLRQSAVPRAELSAAVEDFLAADWSGPKWREASASLGKILLGAVQPELARAGVTSLIVVPDDELFGLPFAALTLPGADRLLVKNYAVAVSPSASLFARAVRKHREDRRKREPWRAVAVADPAVDESVWPHLLPLAAAAAEGASLQRLLPGRAELLDGGDATAPALRNRLAHVSWLHFAGHAVAVPRRPLDSYLLLGPSPEHSGRLTAAEFLTWDLSRLRGVVLSACSSAASARESWPGAITLARPFLAAGVPLVIGSLWDVQDQDSAAFFDSFYRQLAQHGSAFQAFHEAQLAALKDSDGNGFNKNGWIAFQLYGGPDVPVLR